MSALRFLTFVLYVYICNAFNPHTDSIRLREGDISIRARSSDNSVEFQLESTGKVALKGQLGYGLPSAVGTPVGNCDPEDADQCFEYGDFARLYLTAANASKNDLCARIKWVSLFGRRLEDCFDLSPGVHWYSLYPLAWCCNLSWGLKLVQYFSNRYGGGGPTYYDTWPIETVGRNEAPIVAGDSLGGYEYGGVTESYWLLSSGVAIHVDEDVPLFFSIDYNRPGKACFIAEDKSPYKNRGQIYLQYDMCVGAPGENFKDVHQRAIAKYYEKPTGMPDERMMLEPFWSTWAEYKTEVNQSIVLELANRLVEEGFSNSSHVEIDDNWETCYGDATFMTSKFPDPAAMTAEIRKLGFRTTLWTHPFINYGCPSFQTAFERGYFVKDSRGKPTLTQWWQGGLAGLIDFTNNEAVEWWSSRLDLLRQVQGIDAFKFDAGEISWLPPSHNLVGEVLNDPNIAATKYVEAVAKFGGLIEVRVGRQTQSQPIFVRMLDKDSRWGYDNGLQSLIPTLLDFGLKRYPFVLPDMIGGNAYGLRPSKELFIRWMQANAFMPSVQFSILPWDYDAETIGIVRQILALRQEYREEILAAARQAVVDGTPMNRPMWWTDPNDENTQAIDDQYMLGDNILVAPVVTQLTRSRNIYLPRGNWTLAVGAGITYTGPILLTNFSVPLNQLTFFVRS